MRLYAIGDLHLHFGCENPVRAQRNDPLWKDHEKRFEHLAAKIRPEDTLVLVGDHSWGKKLEQCREDLDFIRRLPGTKVLLRGNHDMFWDAGRTPALNRAYEGQLFFLQNNHASFGPVALVGTKGFTFEGPFFLDRRGRVMGWDREEELRAEKLVQREAARLRESFESARRDGFSRFILFLHYPPTSILEEDSVFTRMAMEYGAEQVIYAHSHGESRYADSILGMYRGIRYRLVSGDYLRWDPEMILELPDPAVR